MDFTDERRAVLRALCDTFFPAVMSPEGGDPTGFWARQASDLHIDGVLLDVLAARLPDEVRDGLVQLLDTLATLGFGQASAAMREQIVARVSEASPAAAAGITVLQRLTLMLAYSVPNGSGSNSNWAAFGYPGPLGPPPRVPKPIRPFVPRDGPATLEVDVCVVGSGAGGGVIASTLAAQGQSVVVLEAGGYYNEADFNQLELWAIEHLFWRGGLAVTAEGNVNLLAGANLGGGTTVNYMHCVVTPERVREEWAREFGLEGLDSEVFDEHLEAVLCRISANDRCSDYNGPHLRLKEGAERLGYQFARSMRNADPERYDPLTAAYVGFGDQSGSRRGAQAYLEDASVHAAAMVERCRAERVLVEDGRAAGVAATYIDPSGGETSLVVRASQVVVACGALETPALLLRSGIGGPAVGRFLRLHPVVAVAGVYDEQQHPWWGPPQAGRCEQFADTGDGHGFVAEATHFAPGLIASALAGMPARAHKELMARMGDAAVFIAIARDHGAGQVCLDARGEALVTYPLDDAVDQKNLRRGLAELARVHAAAGAREIHATGGVTALWRRGEDLNAFVARLAEAPIGAGGQPTFSAHQMGSARMGTDPTTSVADPWGQLHDVKGVWIGDTSAFPTAVGVNPMVTCMALAHRTAGAIVEANLCATDEPELHSGVTRTPHR